MDYEALAKQYGGTTASPPVDYEALAKQYGGVTAAPKSLVAQIPGMPAVSAPTPAPSLYQRALGVAEVVPGMLGGVVGGVVAPVAGLVSSLTSGKFGTREGAAAGEQTVKRVQEMLAYKPVTQPGAENIQAVGEVLAPLVGVPFPTLNALARTAAPPLSLAANALRGEAQLVGGAVSEAAKARAAVRQVTNEAKSYANAPQIDAAQTAQRLGVALPPSISNPTKTTRAISAIAGREGDKALGEGNAKQIIKLVKDDIGDTSPDPISLATINNALDVASGPYAPVRALPALRVSDAATQTLNAIPKAPSIGGKAGAAAVSALVDEALLELSKGRSGAAVLDDIRKLRSDAQAIFKANDKGTSAPDPVATDRATAQMQIANTLEDILDANAAPEVVPALRAARTKIAQINDHARALDYASGAIDPQIYAKLLQERKGQMTGLPADLGKVAAIYPSVMVVTPATSFVGPRALRSTLGMGLGAALGTAVGVGPLVGAGAGSVGGAFAGNLAARRMASPAFQAKYAVPPDFRRPAPDTGLTLAPSWEPSAFPAREAPPTQAGNQFTLGDYPSPQAPAQLTMPSIDYPGYPKQPVDIVRRYQEGAEAAQIATEAASRLPTGRGSAFDLDPITGRLRNVSQGMKGATPDVIESTGTLLQSAAKKVTENKQFDMTMAEKIAWNKTKQFISEASPEIKALFPAYKTLSEQQIAIRMADRNIAELAVKKAREKAAGFDEISKRATDAQKIRVAAVNREKMLDLADSLDQQLRGDRPVLPSSQGPKTRAAQRLNQLAPQESQNRLAAP